MPEQNTWERLEQSLASWNTDAEERLVQGLRGGAQPPWTVHVTSDDDIYEGFSRLTPESLQTRLGLLDDGERTRWTRILGARWALMEPNEQAYWMQVMNGGAPGMGG